MAPNILLIPEINPSTTSWTAKVKVVEKSNPRTTSKFRKLQRLLLEDNEGTRVQATIFEPDIEVFEDTLELNRKYHISNAMVRTIHAEYKYVPDDYQWTINSGTLVEEITSDDTNDNKATHYNFTAFSDLRPQDDNNSTVDIIGLAVQISAPQQIKTKYGKTTMLQELLLITQELKPIKMAFWDQFIPNECKTISDTINSWPVVLGNRLKVVNYRNALSLSTTSTSFVQLNPDIPEAAALHTWSIESKELINEAILGIQQPKQGKRASPTKETIIDIATAIKTQPKEAFWIEATNSITNMKQKFWYIGCSNCYRTIYADCGRIYDCRLCNQREVTAQPRCRFEVELSDASGTMKATCLGNNAEKLLSTTAAELKEKTDEAGLTDAAYLATSISTGSWKMLIRQSDNQEPGKFQKNPTIIAIGNKDTEDDLVKNSKVKLE